MKTFTPTQLQGKLATVFNAVQQDGAAVVSGRSRPDMVLMLESEHEAMQEKIRQLADLIKAQGSK